MTPTVSTARLVAQRSSAVTVVRTGNTVRSLRIQRFSRVYESISPWSSRRSSAEQRSKSSGWVEILEGDPIADEVVDRKADHGAEARVRGDEGAARNVHLGKPQMSCLQRSVRARRAESAAHRQAPDRVRFAAKLRSFYVLSLQSYRRVGRQQCGPKNHLANFARVELLRRNTWKNCVTGCRNLSRECSRGDRLGRLMFIYAPGAQQGRILSAAGAIASAGTFTKLPHDPTQCRPPMTTGRSRS